MGIHPLQGEDKELDKLAPTKKFNAAQQNPLYQNYMQKVLFKELKLDSSPRFKSFIADIAINTADLREPETNFTHFSLAQDDKLEDVPKPPFKV